MPLDPNIILQGNTPPQIDVGRAMATGLALQQARQNAQDAAQARQDEQTVRSTLQQSGGDLQSAIKDLYARGQAPAAMKLEQVLAKRQTDAANSLKVTLENEKNRYGIIADGASTVTDQSSQDAFLKHLQEVDPQTAQAASMVFGPTYDPARAEKARGLATSAKDASEIRSRALNDFINGGKSEREQVKFMADALSATPPDHWDTALSQAPSLGVSPEAIAFVKANAQTPEQMKALAVGAEKTAELQQKAATDARVEKHQQVQEGLERQRVGLEGARVGMERQKMAQENALNQASIAAANPNAPHGDAFLQTLPPAQQAQVKALAEGRMQFPGGFALKSPYWQGMLSAVAQYDPNFDTINYNARAKTRSDFTSGKSAQQVNALNTVIGHLDTLSKAADALNNSTFRGVNTVRNYLASETGDPRVTNFKVAREAVADELTRVWRQSGGSEKDIEARKDQLSESNSPEQLHQAIAQIGDLLESKLSSMSEQYAQGTGTQPIEMMTPQARSTLSRLEQRAGKTTATTAAPKEGDTMPIPGYPGTEQTFKNGKWIRTK